MEIIEFMGDTFYVDDITNDLSRRYDTQAYVGFHKTLGEASVEQALGRFMFIAKMVGVFVGVDFETYMKKFAGEPGYGRPTLFREVSLENYCKVGEERAGAELVRIEQRNGKNIYVPTENLVTMMLKGIGYVHC